MMEQLIINTLSKSNIPTDKYEIHTRLNLHFFLQYETEKIGNFLSLNLNRTKSLSFCLVTVVYMALFCCSDFVQVPFRLRLRDRFALWYILISKVKLLKKI